MGRGKEHEKHFSFIQGQPHEARTAASKVIAARAEHLDLKICLGVVSNKPLLGTSDGVKCSLLHFTQIVLPVGNSLSRNELGQYICNFTEM